MILLETVFFPAGLVLRNLFLGRPSARLARSEPGAKVLAPNVVRAGIRPAPGAAAAATGEFVLVALDQRRSNGVIPLTWLRSISAAAAAGRRHAAKVLTAAQNRATFDRLFAEVDRGQEWEDRQTAYVSYRTRAELRELALSARFVVTDLPHVAAWVKDAGRHLIWASPSGLRSFGQNGHPDDDTAELSGWLSVAPVREAAGQ